VNQQKLYQAKCKDKAAFRFSSFFEKAFVSRVNRRISIRIVRCSRSTWGVENAARFGGWPSFEAQHPHSTRSQFPPQLNNAGCRILEVCARVRFFSSLLSPISRHSDSPRRKLQAISRLQVREYSCPFFGTQNSFNFPCTCYPGSGAGFLAPQQGLPGLR